MTPSAYVLPDPLWPQRNVCRPKPCARSRAATSTPPELQVPIGQRRRRWTRCSASRCSAAAGSTAAEAKGRRSVALQRAVLPERAEEQAAAHGRVAGPPAPARRT